MRFRLIIFDCFWPILADLRVCSGCFWVYFGLVLADSGSIYDAQRRSGCSRSQQRSWGGLEWRLWQGRTLRGKMTTFAAKVLDFVPKMLDFDFCTKNVGFCTEHVRVLLKILDLTGHSS